MRITDDVILDLLPMYVAGEASEATQELVERYLRDHPDLARIASQMKEIRPTDTSPGPPADLELKAFARTKQLMLQRSLFLILAVVFTLSMAAAMAFLLDTRPEAGAVSFTFAAIFWVAYWFTGWRASRL